MLHKEYLTTNSLGKDGLLSSDNTVLLEDIPVFIAMLFHLHANLKATFKSTVTTESVKGTSSYCAATQRVNDRLKQHFDKLQKGRKNPSECNSDLG